jgi:hypothetical protein
LEVARVASYQGQAVNLRGRCQESVNDANRGAGGSATRDDLTPRIGSLPIHAQDAAVKPPDKLLVQPSRKRTTSSSVSQNLYTKTDLGYGHYAEEALILIGGSKPGHDP